MAYDYTDDIAFAIEMVAEFGRAVSFGKLAEGVNAADPLGAPTSAAPPAVPGISAAFVYPSGVQNLGLRVSSPALFKSAEQIAIVAADGVNDFAAFDMVTDIDGSIWKIVAVDVFKPGPVPVLYYVGVAR